MLSTRSPARSSRMAGAAGALLLQGGFVLLFLSSMPNLKPPRELAREMRLILRPLPRPAVRPTAMPVQSQTAMPMVQDGPAATATAAPATPLLAIPGLSNLGRDLNDCAPEKYNSLPADQRVRCPRPGAGVAIQEEPNLMGSPSHVKDEAHWEAELARKKSPLLLPCMGAAHGAPIVDFVCLGSMIADGSVTDPHSWPIYKSKQLSPGDFYKVEQAYDAWHKAHPVSPPQAIQPPG